MKSSKKSDLVYAYYEKIFKRLSEFGVKNIVLSPGGRSAPLALLADANQNFKLWIQHDERIAGFFALGLSKADGLPAILICTSGTAAANYTPAIVEAYNSGTPLLVLTADRPHIFRGKGMEQTIFQVGLYGKHLRWSYEMPLLDSAPVDEKPAVIAETMLAKSLGSPSGPPPGPVHINCPFDEPLEPETPVKTIPRIKTQEFKTGKPGGNELKAAELETKKLWQLVKKYPRGLILVGSLNPNVAPADMDSLLEFSVKSGWPLIADGATRVRFGKHITSPDLPLISTAQFLFAPGSQGNSRGFYEKNIPDVILRIGNTPTHKSIRKAVNENPPRHFLWCDEKGFRHAASFPPGKCFKSPLPDLFSKTLSASSGFFDQRSSTAAEIEKEQSWKDLWTSADETARKIIKIETGKNPARHILTEPEISCLLPQMIPPNASLLLGNSLPIRDFDAFAPPTAKSITLFTNRGASGIDGLVATALGISAASKNRQKNPVYLLLGDLSLLHDLGSLIAAKRLEISLNIILINNGGGAIFDTLEHAPKLKAGAASKSSFGRLFLTPSGFSDFQFLNGLPGVNIRQVKTADQLKRFMKAPNNERANKRANKKVKNEIRIAEILTNPQKSSRQRARIRSNIIEAMNK